VAMVFAVWNDENLTLQIANAGATQPLFYRTGPEGSAQSGQIDTIRAEGFPLGLFPGVEYEEISVATQPGDILVFLSDGITDAQNAEGEMFGDERVAALMAENGDASAAELAAMIHGAVGMFQADVEQFDDQTVLVLRVR
jgi:sigma-B regulation protein RsbU (phosphoserine phosphatase)